MGDNKRGLGGVVSIEGARDSVNLETRLVYPVGGRGIIFATRKVHLRVNAPGDLFSMLFVSLINPVTTVGKT